MKELNDRGKTILLVSQRLSYQKQYSSLWRLRSIVIVFAYHDKIQTDIYIYIHAHISPQTPVCFKQCYGCVGYCGKRYEDAMMACTWGHVYTHAFTNTWIHVRIRPCTQCMDTYIHTYIYNALPSSFITNWWTHVSNNYTLPRHTVSAPMFCFFSITLIGNTEKATQDL